jgi:hypothetical protein
MAIKVYDDHTNVFGFFGGQGIFAGRHVPKEFMSSKSFGRLANIFNKISWASAYQVKSDEGHMSYFYANLIFKTVSGTMGAYIDPRFAHYGINLELDSDSNNPSPVFNGATSNIEIPLKNNVIFENYDPHVKFGTLYQSGTLDEYRPQLDGFSYDEGKIIKFYMLDCYTNTKMSQFLFESLSDREMQILIFGFSTIYVGDL